MSEPAFDQAFWQAHPGLAWSNPQATDAQRIRAALLRPGFHTLLAIALHFGLDRLKKEWLVLVDDNDKDVMRAQPSVERILRNIERGHALAAAGN